MNNRCSRVFFTQFLIILMSCLVISCRQSPDILSPISPSLFTGVLVLNSDKSIDKYTTIQQAFISELDMQTMEIDFSGQVLNSRTLAKKLSKFQPSLIYVIGSKAYTQATQIIKDQPLVFSSMINWRRFEIGAHTYGISLELPIEMQLFMYSYLFPEIKNLGVLYSETHNSQWFELAVVKAKEVQLSLHGQTIKNVREISKALKTLLPKIDALWLISDPVVLYDTNQVQKIFAKAATHQKPIFAYNTLFTKYGAVLTMAADIPTMGRQAAGLARDLLKQQGFDEKVQFPAGSHVTLNLKKVHEYGITLNHEALASVENIIQ